MSRRLPHIGTEDEYTRCFSAPLFAMSEAQCKMLIGHARVSVLTMRDIAVFGGYTSFRSGNAIYGRLAQRIREAINLPFYKYHVMALFTDVGKNGDGEWCVRNHDEVRGGLHRAGLT